MSNPSRTLFGRSVHKAARWIRSWSVSVPEVPAEHVFRASLEIEDPPKPALAGPPSDRDKHPSSVTKRSAGRSKSPSLLKAIELVQSRPEITAQQVAEEVGVSRDYARVLLKRARARVSGTGSEPSSVLASAEAERREPDIHQLAQAPVRVAGNLHLDRRSNVIRLNRKGTPADVIASDLGLSRGEVEFILKVNRLAAELH